MGRKRGHSAGASASGGGGGEMRQVKKIIQRLYDDPKSGHHQLCCAVLSLAVLYMNVVSSLSLQTPLRMPLTGRNWAYTIIHR